MLRIVRILVTLYAAIVLQTTIVPLVAIYGVRPDLPMLVVLLVALREGAAGGALAGFVAGLFVDLSSAQMLGVTSLANSLTAFGVGWVADRLVRSSSPTRMLVAFAAVAVRDQFLVALGLADGFWDGLRLLFTFSIPGGLYTAILAVPGMMLAEKAVGWGKETLRGFR